MASPMISHTYSLAIILMTAGKSPHLLAREYMFHSLTYGTAFVGYSSLQPSIPYRVLSVPVHTVRTRRAAPSTPSVEPRRASAEQAHGVVEPPGWT